MIKLLALAICLSFVSIMPAYADEPAAPTAADKAAVEEVNDALQNLAKYIKSEPKPDAAQLDKLVEKVQTEAKTLINTASNSELVRQKAFEYALVSYLVVLGFDGAKYFPKFKGVVADCKAKFPGSPIASVGDSWLLQLEMSSLDAAGFLARITDYAKTYPKSQAGPEILVAYADTLIDKDLAAAKKMVEDGLNLYASDITLLQFKQTLERIGKPAELVGTTFDGKAFDLKDLKGKVVVVDFWASWCAPCKAMTPALIAFYKEMAAKGVEIVGISADKTQKDAEDYVTAHKIGWTQLFFAKQTDLRDAAAKFGATVLPTLYVIDKEGNFATVGRNTLAPIVKAVEAALAK